MSWAVVRIRGSLHAQTPIVETLRLLHLTRANHAVILPERDGLKGMVHRVQGYVTYGPVKAETVKLLLTERGVADDGSPLRADAIPPALGVKDLDALAEQVLRDGTSSVKGLRPLFRLKPPRGGWGSTKKPYLLGGSLGFRPAGAKRDMDELIRRMV
jgi:large subunit ribosomal protein L30